MLGSRQLGYVLCKYVNIFLIYKKNKTGPPDPRVWVWVFFSDSDPDS